MIHTGKNLEVMNMNYKTTGYMAHMSLGKHFGLLLITILALLLAACGGGGSGSDGGGGGGGGGANASCTLTQAELDNLTPDNIPAACEGISFFDIPSFAGTLFILGTEINGTELKLYAHGVNLDGTPMTLADFKQAVVTLNNTEIQYKVDKAPAGVLSVSLLSDYSSSISETELTALSALYNEILNKAPAEFEGEIINFSSVGSTPAITVKPDPSPYWTEFLPALTAATEFDDAQARGNTTLYDGMGTALLGDPVSNSDPNDQFGLVERVELGRPARLMITQTDGLDNVSATFREPEDIESLIERCKIPSVMLGTSREFIDTDVLEQLAGSRGAFIATVNSNFLAEAIGPYAESLGNLVVFTVSIVNDPNETVEITVNRVAASESAPFGVDASCQ
jgi:hypothetical protein